MSQPTAHELLVEHGDLAKQAANASQYLKSLSHESRLLILCHLAMGDRSVSELEELIGSRQSAVSQQLARLRADGLVTTRRDGKSIYYSIKDPRARKLVEILAEMFCPQNLGQTSNGASSDTLA